MTKFYLCFMLDPARASSTFTTCVIFLFLLDSNASGNIFLTGLLSFFSKTIDFEGFPVAWSIFFSWSKASWVGIWSIFSLYSFSSSSVNFSSDISFNIIKSVQRTSEPISENNLKTTRSLTVDWPLASVGGKSFNLICSERYLIGINLELLLRRGLLWISG